MNKYDLEVTLTLIGPILTHSSAPREPGIDSGTVRDQDDRPFLPYSLVKGRVAQSWDELGLTETERWFGEEPDGGDLTPHRGLFRFSDFRTKVQPGDGVRHRIAICDETGAVREGALQIMESPFAPGEEVEFRGNVTWLGETDKTAELRRAFRWTASYGANRTIGFGRVARVGFGRTRVTALQQPDTAVAQQPAASYDVEIHMLDPFCLTKRRVTQNLFESSTTISGAVLRGYLATTINESLGRPARQTIEHGEGAWPQLRTHFNRIQFSHAFPSTQVQRPYVPPLSLVKAKTRDEEKWFDVALCDGPLLIDGRAPSFSIDWKDDADVREAFGIPELATELRVRTAIEPGHRRAAEGLLFAYEMIVADESVCWRGRMDLSDVPAEDRPAVAADLRQLFALQLPAIGKTKARASITITESQRGNDPVKEEGPWVVTLQTPAVLLDAAAVNGSASTRQMHDAYDAALFEVSRGAVRLVRHFARQRLAGGYQAKRFAKKDAPYNPYLLTDAGSVFVVTAAAGREADARAAIEQWLRCGLQMPSWAVQRYGTSWWSCAYLPEDGFGEVAVDLECHRARRPEAASFAPVDLARDAPERRQPATASSAAHSEMGSERPPEFPVSQANRKRWPQITSRSRIRGTLTTKTNLHIGDGSVAGAERLVVEKGRKGSRTTEEVDVSSIAMTQRGGRKVPYIPGSAIKGALRAWLVAHAPARDGAHYDEYNQLLDGVFGRGNSTSSSATAGKAEFHDVIATVPEHGLDASVAPHVPWWMPERLTGVAAHAAIDRRTRAARHQKLFYKEFVPAGVQFDVSITGDDLTEEETALLLLALDAFNESAAGLDRVHLGSDSADGWGVLEWHSAQFERLEDVDSTARLDTFAYERLPERTSTSYAAIARFLSTPSRVRIELTLAFDGPFVVNDPSRSKNGEDRSHDEQYKPADHTPLAEHRSGCCESARKANRECHGWPVLPGGAFAGAFRAHAERIVRTLGGHACRSTDPDDACQTFLPDLREGKRPAKQQAAEELCLTCRVFGAAGWASTVATDPFAATTPGIFYRQDFVAVDRFTGGAAEGAKFDAEAFWSPEFKGAFAISDRAPDYALGLIALALRDMAAGDVPLGFGASKGYGSCKAKDVTWPAVQDVENSRKALLKATGVHAALADAARRPDPVDVPSKKGTAHVDGDFRNPYHFVPAKGESRTSDLSVTNFDEGKRGHVTHATYSDDAFSGRFKCALTTKTPLVIGARRHDGAPTDVDPFCWPGTGEPAIPATSLRGVISSIAEAASNSAMRVLENAPYTRREKRAGSSKYVKVPFAHSRHFFVALDPELLPFNAERMQITIAEQLYGFVQEGDEQMKKDGTLSRAMAGRLRFSFGKTDTPDPWVAGEKQTLRVLGSPKPPSPAMYFKTATGGAYIAKNALNAKDHRPQGRKFYLHHEDARTVAETDPNAPWRTRSSERDNLKNGVRLIRREVPFTFDVAFDNLSAAELGLLCYSLAPSDAFEHKLGMGKPLGLGSVKIDIKALQLIDRRKRYGSETWSQSTDVGTRDATADVPAFRSAFAAGMDGDIRRALALIGESKCPDVGTPQLDNLDAESDTFKWFVQNDGKGGARQYLVPLDSSMTNLPKLWRGAKATVVEGRPPEARHASSDRVAPHVGEPGLRVNRQVQPQPRQPATAAPVRLKLAVGMTERWRGSATLHDGLITLREGAHGRRPREATAAAEAISDDALIQELRHRAVDGVEGEVRAETAGRFTLLSLRKP